MGLEWALAVRRGCGLVSCPCGPLLCWRGPGEGAAVWRMTAGVKGGAALSVPWWLGCSVGLVRGPLWTKGAACGVLSLDTTPGCFRLLLQKPYVTVSHYWMCSFRCLEPAQLEQFVCFSV